WPQAAAALRSAWTGDGARPHTSKPSLHEHAVNRLWFAVRSKSKASRHGRLSEVRGFAQKLFLRGLGLRGFGFGSVALGVLAAEALHATGGVHKLLLAGKEWVAGGANFYADVALVGGACDKRVAAGAMHADFAVVGMDSCFHVSPKSSSQILDSIGV